MDFWTQYGENLTMLGIYAGGITVYTLIVAALYMPMGTRLMFARRLSEDKVATVGRRFLYVLLFPLVSFGFFLLIAGALFFLTDFSGASKLPPDTILTIAMGTVLAIRVCAYFSENAAEELAKVMPLGLLGVFLVTNQIESVNEAFANLGKLFDHLDLIGIFFAIVVVVEFLLRIVYEAVGRPNRKQPPKPVAARPAHQPPPPTFQRRP